MFVLSLVTVLFILVEDVKAASNWCEIDGVIRYISYESECLRSNWYTESNVTTMWIKMKTGCCLNEMITFDETFGNGTTLTKSFYFLDNNYINIKTLFIRESSQDVQILVYERARPEGLFVSFGCYNGNKNCRTSVNSSTPSKIDYNQKGISLYSDIDQKFWIWYYLPNARQPVQLFINGVVKQSVVYQYMVKISLGEPYSKKRFLFTGNSDENMIRFEEGLTTGTFIPKAVCDRFGYKRFLLFKEGENYENVTTRDCTCQREGVKLLKNYYYNYPDCVYNSSLFDLALTNLTTYNWKSITISIEITDWYSVIFAPDKFWTFIREYEDVKYLNFTVFDMKEQVNVEFQMSVYINKLIISSIGNYYFIEDVVINTVEYKESLRNKVLFSVDGKLVSNDGNLNRCGRRAFYSKSDDVVCFCNYTNNNWEPNTLDLINQNDCFNDTKRAELTLQIDSNEYETTSIENWGKIIFKGIKVKVTGSSTLCGQNVTVQNTVAIHNKLEIQNTLFLSEKSNLVVSNKGKWPTHKK
ncbi:hypothetical protein EHI_009130 [Entamoeba histolytica HM-1:IMSS]|uniref:Uncharacterized protein n=1 Tax=Entamoeba histolytica (strain ATCC 30459 / HM-1:IMSS / ABRM) TaxID=294381 RepID=B1N5Q5_ENTH1|nr:hypothetical protein EHI_009130 [Entamoeba histolytica HM-1:IMSS]EDS88703.1 hypothetical protein EHI_009130 [Entamoeba histolytica HM-1:IMSS]|eukprot:XP_001914521.1 hypothetical protein EHI_009130 [Entamoeba histolytica HM-1:IMSS]